MVYTQEQVIDMATKSYVTPQMVIDQMGGASALGDEFSVTLDNLKYAYNQSPAFYREVVADTYGWNGQAVTATETLIPQPVMAQDNVTVLGTTAEKYPAVTTPAGNVRSGALAGRLPIGTLVAGVAIGAGIGLKEAVTHTKFWEDVGNAVQEDIKRDPTAGIDPLALTDTTNVIWRAMQDGSIQAYCDKRDIDAVVDRLYQFNAFDVFDTITPEATQEGYIDITSAGANSGFAIEAGQLAGVNFPNIAVVYDTAVGHYSQANVFVTRVEGNASGAGVVVYCYNVPDGRYYMRKNPNPEYYYIDATQDMKVGTVTATLNDVGEIEHLNYIDGSALSSVYSASFVEAGAQGTAGWASNFATVFTPKNPNVIYNGTDLLPPSDPDDFWNTFALWLANSFTINPYNPATNAYEPVTYVPFTAPDINWQNDPITGDQPRVWTGQYEFVDPFTSPTTTPVNNPNPWIFESIGDYVIPRVDIPTSTPWDNNPKFPTPTPYPIGSSPTLVAPSSGVSSGSRLYSVYNPSQANIDSLGAYLWDSNIIDQICKFFSNNPLDAIISLHMVYCTPTTGSNKNIYLGYLDSGVSSPIVTSQYETIACGDVDVPELYGNALDYDGVSIQAFLPFIGWRTLRTKEVMGKRVRVTYKIDVYTGVCLAMISVISAGSDQLLYTFEGNCSVQIPLTASDRTRLISGLITAGVSAYTGNPAGVVGGIASIKQDVDRSGSFSGNAGAMGVKKPYLVISRALNAQASNYNSLYGYPLNKSGVLKNFRGFTRVQSVHVDIPGATDYEKRLISDLLHRGVII